MKKILPLILLLLCCITMYAQDGYTFERITVNLTEDKLHPAQVLRTRKLNKYNKPVYEENYNLCYPNEYMGCDRDSSELHDIVLYEYRKDTVLVKKTTYNVQMQSLYVFEDTTIITYKYDNDGKLTEEFSSHYGLHPYQGCVVYEGLSWNDTTNIYHKYNDAGLLLEDIIVRAERPGQNMVGHSPEDKVNYYYDKSKRLMRMEHYDIASMGRDEISENKSDTTLTYIFTYTYHTDNYIEKVVRMRDGQADTVNTIIHYNDPYRNVLPFYVKTPERFYTIYLYDHNNKLLSERTYGGADNVLMTEKKY